MSEQTIYPEILARIALKDAPSMVAVLHEIHRSHTNHDDGQVGEVIAAFAAEIVGAFREATVIIDELQQDRADLLARLVAAQEAVPVKRRSSRKGN